MTGSRGFWALPAAPAICSAGFDATVDAVTAGQAKLVLCAADISPKTDKEWRYAVRRTPVRALTLPLTKEQLGHALVPAPPRRACRYR